MREISGLCINDEELTTMWADLEKGVKPYSERVGCIISPALSDGTFLFASFRACVAGPLSGSGSGSSTGALPNVFLEKPFSLENRGAGAVLEEPLLWRSPSGGAMPNTPLE
jgi:hypothetical protein